MQLLKNINVERDVKRKRDTIKKVIAYMTLGIDVSRLFTDMIMVRRLICSVAIVQWVAFWYLFLYLILHHQQPAYRL